MNSTPPPTGPRYPDPSGVRPGRLTTQPQVMLVQTRKDVGIAYILWLFFGMVGAHRFYLRQVESGVAMLVLTVIGWASLILLVGFVFLGIALLWVLIDLFLIPGMTREANAKVAM